MGRRETAGSFFGILLASGLAAMIALTALTVPSLYFKVLLVGGAVGILVGLAGIIWLFFTAKPVASATNDRAHFRFGEAKGVSMSNIEVEGDQPFLDVEKADGFRMRGVKSWRTKSGKGPE